MVSAFCHPYSLHLLYFVSEYPPTRHDYWLQPSSVVLLRHYSQDQCLPHDKSNARLLIYTPLVQQSEEPCSPTYQHSLHWLHVLSKGTPGWDVQKIYLQQYEAVFVLLDQDSLDLHSFQGDALLLLYGNCPPPVAEVSCCQNLCCGCSLLQDA